jgi:hypothetical protein
MKTITICSSVAFGRQVVEVQKKLEAMGFTVLIPESIEHMAEDGNFDPNSRKTWVGEAPDFGEKARLMRVHFDKVKQADIVLVLNYEKHGVSNYIGGNVLMEMSLAFYLGKPLYILHDFPEESAFLEEIKGMQPTVLRGELEALSQP